MPGRDDLSRILSRPHRVHWDGWTTTTTQLQQAGWSLSAEQDFATCRIRLAMRNERLKMTGICYPQDFQFFHGARSEHLDRLEFAVQYMASSVVVQMVENSAMAFKPIDAMPQFVTTKRTCIEDMGIFATPLVRTKELIVDPKTVDELLKEIVSMQKPEQLAIRERNKTRDYMTAQSEGAIPRQVFHAQLISEAA